ncbi:MAG: hypothetical protein CM1200mP36_02300 [Gammaproteobacteria bacterium]|nr:MAG: hypothetical protein CM1200mP36_02300 [Gammaproteobacteria bacterium]
MIRAAYNLLELQTFYTAVHRRPEHGPFEKGFPVHMMPPARSIRIFREDSFGQKLFL